MNPFSLNLSYLKKQAKTRLKAIKSGSQIDLIWLNEHHFINTHKAENVKLSDIQLAISRELGLSSWAKLKHHVELLESNRNQPDNVLIPLDDLHTLHVRCGHDIQGTLKKSGFIGDFLPYIDPFCIGPLVKNEQNLLTLRSEFIYHNLILEMEGVNKSIEHIQKDSIRDSNQLLESKYQRIVLWVEHDNYDQIMLIRTLALLSYQNLDRVELIEIDKFPGRECFIGLGQLPSEALRVLWDTRKELTIDHITAAKSLWAAFCSPTPKKLIEQYSHIDESLFPNIKRVIFRHLQELPHSTSRLGLTQELTIQLLKENKKALDFNTLFKRYMEAEPLVFLADLMYWAVIKPLTLGETPIIYARGLDKSGWQSTTIELCHDDFKSVSTVENKWIGGIQIGSSEYWTWDHKDLSTMNEITFS
ncbi:DUF1835 domain-containing protein [Vibrio sp. S9_S30]|uniref:DUF1835 domain-containing protein n=1 Tax=Vibrio sp. S9_S30 TaxID=2720226 RepID=UPI0016804A14|nr:DUF1835 domain-containing protein [Vibrio sp. S9_S30]MBD1559888.1 DUF1835 domain-containing protein [Vibrio sp. S9_S30]